MTKNTRTNRQPTRLQVRNRNHNHGITQHHNTEISHHYSSSKRKPVVGKSKSRRVNLSTLKISPSFLLHEEQMCYLQSMYWFEIARTIHTCEAGIEMLLILLGDVAVNIIECIDNTYTGHTSTSFAHDTIDCSARKEPEITKRRKSVLFTSSERASAPQDKKYAAYR